MAELLEQEPEVVARSDARALTWKSLTLGVLLVLLAALGGFYARHILHTTRLAQNHLSLAVVFPFVVTVLFLRRPLKLNRGELLVIFSMGLIASTLPTYFLSRLVASFCVPYYLADPTNGWAEYTHSFLPSWAIIPKGPALTWFFEGLPRGESVPWEVWAGPLFWWLSLLAALCAVLLCTSVILRKQWIEYERLDYALMELPLAMLEDEGEGGGRMPGFMRSPVFWVGFGFSIFGILWNILSYFSPNFPAYPWRLEPIHLGHHFLPIRMNLYWPIVGFTYFINLDISFSICFFFVLAVLEEGIFNRLGVKIAEANHNGTSFVPVGWQMMGVWMVVVGWGLYIARDHLKDVFRKAFRGDPEVDDSDELISYRGAVFGLLLGLLYLGGWLYASGMAAWVVLVFLVGMMVVYIGITRIIAETGVITIRAVMVPQTFIMFTWGTVQLTGPTLTSLCMTFGWHGDMKTTLMPALAHSVKLFDTVRQHKRHLVWALIVAMGVGIVSSLGYIITAAYETGAGNYGSQLSGGLARGPWDFTVKYAKSPVEFDWRKMAFLASGIGLAALLYFLRYRWAWWPFHPLGLAAGPAYPVTNVIFPIFLGWLAKGVILKFGGSKAYQAARPFFLGLIMGYYMGAGVSFFVDMIWFPGDGHGVPFSD
ncbi:MAG: hypothetical protein O7G87_19315 [bacterium]|nr:hypothetical protein [bacterium]